ncbi:MAG: hypothetical protein EOO43_04705 [Flavobacterium sp.]|nr:MAG: hypothetical protein EOO43_04705 [Flavobacterium sp.]
MRIGIMQPYFMPYIGYFQMLKAVDTFVFYDDVNFIKQGWINRNRILINDKDFLFTIPLHKANSFNLIKDTLINKKLYDNWKRKFLQSITQNYKKAPNFTEVNTLINNILDTACTSISQLAIESVIATSKYLGIETTFFVSSERYQNIGLERQERLLDICKKEGATHYLNALGGQELYTKESFEVRDITLSFIKTKPIVYKQFTEPFVPWLSMIDVLMFNSVVEVNEMLDKYELM